LHERPGELRRIAALDPPGSPPAAITSRHPNSAAAIESFLGMDGNGVVAGRRL
jgi:hypothetical protein